MFNSYINKWTSVTCKWIDNQHGGIELKDPPHHWQLNHFDKNYTWNEYFILSLFYYLIKKYVKYI
jgi:hypothetical protein